VHDLKAAKVGAVTARHDESYRPALDGIRAIAVLSVIAYHFGYSWLPGGFLGVDVFFVLSGYLITSLLLREFERTRRIAFGEFWARRVRRLLPALLLLVLVVSVWVYRVAPVETWMARRRDLLWTLFYGANWHFIDTSQDYFAKYTGASPLLHTWSLAIEEQFYFLWPIAFFALSRVLRSRRWPMFAVCVTAAGLSAVRMATLYDSSGLSRAYYGTDSRIQALLVGVALALLPIWAKQRLQPLAGWIGALLVAAVAVFFVVLDDRAVLYYRGGAFLLALVVAGLIWAVEVAPRGLVGRALSARPLAWIGRISYGLYLWHWFVVIVALHLASSNDTSVSSPVVQLSLTFAAATVSYYIVERPIREGRTPWMRRSPVRLAVVAPVVIALVAFVAIRTTTPDSAQLASAQPTPISSESSPSGAGTSQTKTATPAPIPIAAVDQHLDVSLESALADHSDKECPKTSNDVYKLDWCIFHQGPSDGPVLATIGDSMARAFKPGLEAEGARRGFTYAQAAWGGCTISGTAVAQVDPTTISLFDQDCRDNAVSAVEAMMDAAHPSVLIMTEHGAAISRLQVNGRWVAALTPEHDRALIDGYETTFGRLLSRVDHIVVIETNQDGLPIGCVEQTSAPGARCSQSPSNVEAIERFNGVLHTVAERFPGQVSVISISDLVCPNATCLPIRDGMLIRYDGQHYTATFSRWLVPRLLDRITAASGVRF
jgi:peptidoglycan/LPS O-acetylase OafA/YrhL